MTDLEFLAAIKDDVINDMKESGILASLTASQAFLESNKGNSKLSKDPNNNLFGMKGSYNGQYVIMPTKEYKNGQYITIEAKFRKYPSWRASIKDHSDLFLKMTRYKNLIGETDYIRACFNVQEDGYATSPTYAKSLITVIEKYKLYEWDKTDPEPVDLDLAFAVDVLAHRVIDGKFGQGHEMRKNSIYELIRKRVNDILK